MSRQPSDGIVHTTQVELEDDEGISGTGEEIMEEVEEQEGYSTSPNLTRDVDFWTLNRVQLPRHPHQHLLG